MSNELPPELLKKLKDTFFVMDIDKDSQVTSNEALLIIRALGIYLTEAELKKLGADMDAKFKGKLTFENFKNIFTERYKNNKSCDELISAFKFFDVEDKGTLNLHELKHGLMSLGEALTEEEFNVLREEMALESDGSFNYEKLAQELFKK